MRGFLILVEGKPKTPHGHLRQSWLVAANDENEATDLLLDAKEILVEPQITHLEELSQEGLNLFKLKPKEVRLWV